MNNNDYLKTPEHFKMLVESKVNEQLNTPISDKKKPTTSIQTKKEKSGYHFKKIAAAAAVIAIITTTSVFAAKHFRLSDYFESSTETYNESYMETIDNRDISVKNGFPEQMKQFEQNTNKVFDEPLFTLTEAYYDGNYLYIYAQATDAGQEYDAITSRIFINGTQYIGDFGRLLGQTETNGFNQDEYVGTFALDGLESDNFTVEMPLSIYLASEETSVTETSAVVENDSADNTVTPALIRQGQQTVSFKVTAADRVLGYTDQQITVNSDVTADISDLKRTELGIRLNLTWHLDASAAERYLYDFEYTDEENDNLSGYAKPDYQVTDDKGTNYGNDQIHINQIQATSEDVDPVLVIRNEDGSADCISKVFISNVPEDAKQLTLQLKHNGQTIDEMTVEFSLK